MGLSILVSSAIHSLSSVFMLTIPMTMIFWNARLAVLQFAVIAALAGMSIDILRTCPHQRSQMTSSGLHCLLRCLNLSSEIVSFREN